MAPPPSQVCGKAECQYSTPEGVPSWELVVEMLRMHRQDAHPEAQQPPQVGDHAASAKPCAEKVPRPQIKLGVSQDEFSYFQDVYPASTDCLNILLLSANLNSCTLLVSVSVE